MYPDGELKDLARERQLIMRRIARHRAECVVHATRVAQPLQWVNRTHGELRKVSSFGGMVAGPIGLFAIRMVTKRMGKLGALVRWGPLAYSVAKSFMDKPANRPR